MTAEDTFALFRRHGGRLDLAQAAFPQAPQPWIDLSTGVNPTAWRGRRAPYQDLLHLPQRRALEQLERTAAVSFGCRPDEIAATPGIDIGLRLTALLLHQKTVAILSPTYQGHAEAWTNAGASVIEASYDDWLQSDAAVLIAVNPNNPTGEILDRNMLLSIAARQHQKGGWLIIDESFADVAPDCSLTAAVVPGLIVFRSFGKFFGLPGVRLGFIVAAANTIQVLRRSLGDWPVSHDAIQLGTRAYADLAWCERMRDMLEKQAQRLDRVLTACGFQVIGGTSLFRLTAHPDAAGYFKRLAARGVLVRPFEYRPHWLRFGLPRTSEWPRVAGALQECRHDY
jgi:cobalamin biosynthetic protein CobC